MTPDQFTRLYLDMRRPLFSFVYARTNDPQLAEDIAQETLLRAWVSPGPVHAGWLFRVAGNLIIDNARAARNQRPPLSDAHPDARAVSTPAHEPSRSDELAVALAGVKPRARQVLYCRYWRGLTQDETSAALGISRESVRAHSFRGRKIIRDRMRDASSCG